MSEVTAQAKQKRKYALGRLTRVRRRALVIINAKGSRTELLKMMPDIDEAFLNLEIITDQYIETLEDADAVEKAQSYKAEAERQYQETMALIEQYLKEGKDEPETVAIGSQCSKTSQLSSASKKAEIAFRVKELEFEQLKKRHERKRKEEDLKRANELEEAKEAREAAELEAKLTLAAETELNWERRNDFLYEQAVGEEDNGQNSPKEKQQSPPVFQVTAPEPRQTTATAEVPRHIFEDSRFLRNLPRLELEKFNGDPGEWPRWFSLFRTLVDNHPSLSATEKMAHLQGAVVGPAQKTIAGMFYDGRLYQAALNALEDRYGRREDVVHSNLSAVFNCPSPIFLDAESMDHFHSVLHSAVSVLQNLGYEDDLRSSENLRNVVTKLPTELRKEWGHYTIDMEPTRPTLSHLDEWLKRQVRVAVNFSKVSRPDEIRLGKAKKTGTGITSLRRTAFNTEVSSSACISCGEQHRVDMCPLFLEKDVNKRAEFVITSGICFYCLKAGHRARHCQVAKQCGIDGCRMRHHSLLHGSRRIIRSTVEGETKGAEQVSQSHDSRVIAAACNAGQHATTLLQVVQVKILGEQGRSKIVSALLDPGAQTSLCCDDVLQDLRITGEEHEIQLQTVRGRGRTQRSRRVELTLLPIKGICTKPIFVSEVFSVPEMHIKTPHLERRLLTWDHLRDLDIAGYNGQRVELLLGANVVEAVLQQDARVGNPGEPIAVRTAFGWALTGSLHNFVPEHIKQILFVHRAKAADEMHEFIQEWWKTESFGTKFGNESSMSAEDRRALDILRETTRKVGNHYEVGLLWKSDDVKMPNNYNAALRRLMSTERSLNKQPKKAAAYEEALMGYVNKGHARKLTATETAHTSPKTWFLPHHGVSNPNKSKLRIVFDAAATCKGICLNDMLLTGPDMLQNLVGILMRFREERVALMADITEMFHQVRVRTEDQPALTFLWRSCDTSRPPDHYRMLVAIFGARCSPAAASYVLQRTADGHLNSNTSLTRSAAAVRSSFYMDDFLHSEKTVAEAREIKEGVTRLVSEGGFVLTKWVSSHPEVLGETRANTNAPPSVDLLDHQQGCERALGCVWIPQEDVIGVKHRVVEVPETKRGILRRVSMIFDPLGIVAPYTLRAKVLVQRLWSLKYEWDESLQGRELQDFRTWISELPHLENVSIPRCYKTSIFREPDEYELHVFCDASETAFGAVAYVRMTAESSGDEETEIVCSFVMAKTRLAPLKQLTIARLELQAAVLACRLAESVKKAITYRFSRCFYWTDSKIVLAYIRHESRRFHTFTANRVAEIHDLSNIDEWHHVPGELNPADACSRGASGATLNCLTSWWNGPAFLGQAKRTWPEQNKSQLELDTSDSEVRSSPLILSTQLFQPTLPDPARFSSWLKYTRIVAWVHRFIKNLKAVGTKDKKDSAPLNGSEIRLAVKTILIESQRRSFLDDINTIASAGSVPPSSCLFDLTPFLDDKGLLRVGGRLSRAPLPETTRHSIILGRYDEVTRLIVYDAHERVLHAGVDHTLSELRRQYWIPKARATVRRIVNKCALCRNRKARPFQPIMSDLPRHRFDATRPFRCAGLDLFGPLQVRRFRKTEKRWVLLITCLSTRALHLELVGSLDTDSFLMGLRRFFGRRGKPSVIYSDNGTNIVAGEKELRSLIKEWNQSQILDELSQNQIDWHFNPPTASHMGGIWERLVASVKRSLRVVLGHQVVSEEELSTVLVEVESVLNSRPITYCSGDVRDPEPLTPRHFLLGYPEAVLPPGSFDDETLLSKKRWRHTQVLADHFWQRWRREYLPTLIRREKWAQAPDNLREGDIIMMVDDQAPRSYWPLATITRVIPGEDGYVRSVELKTGSGMTYVRPANKVCLLERVQ